jgi:hypothetical protein
MSKRKYLGTDLDKIFRSTSARSPDFRVFIWNPTRTSINDIVLGQEESPRYDITPWVISVSYTENIIYENAEDSVATNLSLEMIYSPDATPIQITEKTVRDNTPIRVYQGDRRIPIDEWICVFTGVIRGNPAITEYSRDESKTGTMSIVAVERAEAFLNTKVTSESYLKDTDIGKAVVETAIKYMGLYRDEINIGNQDYTIGHPQSQLVDIEIMNGLAQMLFCSGKKPKFDSEGYLCAADTDLDKAPIRVHDTMDLIITITREAVMTAINNSVRLLGLDDDLTEVVEREKRLAHGTITSGFFESVVRQKVSFSETEGTEQGGRRAKNIRFDSKRESLGQLFGEEVSWQPIMEDDGVTCFGGNIVFDTGYDATIREVLLGVWLAAKLDQLIAGLIAAAIGLESAAASYPYGTAGGLSAAGTALMAAQIGEYTASIAMMGIILSLIEMGRVEWTVYGEPFQWVYQQLCATAQVSGLLTHEIRELQLKNDWLYDIDTLQLRAKDLLKRELIKGWSYEIIMMDDPFLEVDDVIQIGTRKYYITKISKRISRKPDGTMTMTAWRFA